MNNIKETDSVKNNGRDFSKLNFGLGQISQEVWLVMQLQRYLGLIFREAVLFNDDKAMSCGENMLPIIALKLRTSFEWGNA